MTSEELQYGATTVMHLSQHFTRMKTRATELVNSIQASRRGFFTPTEDEQTRHLLVSYWQARNALFEAVSSFHQIDRFEAHQRQIALIIAYAGALVLVDVARFLRENVHHRPVVRTKLNERPAPGAPQPEGPSRPPWHDRQFGLSLKYATHQRVNVGLVQTTNLLFELVFAKRELDTDH